MHLGFVFFAQVAEMVCGGWLAEPYPYVRVCVSVLIGALEFNGPYCVQLEEVYIAHACLIPEYRC